MPDITKDGKQETERPVTRRLAWFIGLYCAGLLVTGIAVYLLRFLLGLN